MASDGFTLCDIMEDCASLLLCLTGVILGWSSSCFCLPDVSGVQGVKAWLVVSCLILVLQSTGGKPERLLPSF